MCHYVAYHVTNPFLFMQTKLTDNISLLVLFSQNDKANEHQDYTNAIPRVQKVEHEQEQEHAYIGLTELI